MLAHIRPELRRYLWIEGRSSRREWWAIEGLAIVGYWFVGAGAAIMAELSGESTLLPLQTRLPLAALVFWINLASTVRRLHDRNKSGWWALAYAFPGFGILWHFIECGFLPGRDKGNRYGPAEVPSALAPWIKDPWAQLQKASSAPPAAHRAQARQHRAATPRGTRIIGPVAHAAVTRSPVPAPSKTILAIASAIAIGLLASIWMTGHVQEVAPNPELPIFQK
jgi:uncharacterized membrane protein YhaH (DUF805 family)